MDRVNESGEDWMGNKIREHDFAKRMARLANITLHTIALVAKSLISSARTRTGTTHKGEAVAVAVAHTWT